MLIKGHIRSEKGRMMMSGDSKLIDCTYTKRRILRGVEELKACALGDG